MNYKEQLKHPKWQKVRLQALEFYDWKCQECGDTETTLHVHHNKYVNGREPWEYPFDELQVLCEDCHKKEHNKINFYTFLDSLIEKNIKNMKIWENDDNMKKYSYLIWNIYNSMTLYLFKNHENEKNELLKLADLIFPYMSKKFNIKVVKNG